MPGLKKAEIDGRLEAAGIDMVYVMCVNDGAVMTAWKKDQGLAGSEMIDFIADTQAELTQALGLQMTGDGNPFLSGPRDGPNLHLGYHTMRCKRAALFVDNGVIKVVQVSEAADDPAGDDKPEASCVENMLDLIGKL